MSTKLRKINTHSSWSLFCCRRSAKLNQALPLVLVWWLADPSQFGRFTTTQCRNTAVRFQVDVIMSHGDVKE